MPLSRHTAQARTVRGRFLVDSLAGVRVRLRCSHRLSRIPNQSLSSSCLLSLPASRQHPFGSGIAYPAGYAFPLPFGSWHSLLEASFPTEESRSLPFAYCGVSRRPHWGLHVPLVQDATGVGALYVPGSWYPRMQPENMHTCDPIPSSLSATIRRFGITALHRGFTCVHPSGLSLACGLPLGLAPPWAFNLSLKTPSLPMTQREVGTGIGHLPESENTNR